MKNLKFIVTGTGRCGTVFLAKFLTSIGVPCCHEGIFNFEPENTVLTRMVDPRQRIVSQCSVIPFLGGTTDENWVDATKTIADSSYMAMPYLNHPALGSVAIIHVVRNPLEVISSFVNDFGYFELNVPNKNNIYDSKLFEDFIWKSLPELSLIDTQLERACWYYYQWNRLIELFCKHKKYIRIKIEDFNRHNLCDFVGGKKDLLQVAFQDHKANTNKKHESLKLDDFPEGIFKKLLIESMLKYNYQNRKLL